MKKIDQQPHHLHSIDTEAVVSTVRKPLVAMIIFGALILGVATGFAAHLLMPKSGVTMAGVDRDATEIDASGQKTSAGILDKETFKDSASGMLKEGGFEGEGSFHIERPGGKSQNVYLTSSTVDLNEFVGKQVTIWGKTFDAEKAGWLMDVGYITLSN